MKQQVLFIHCAGPQGACEGSDYLVAFLRNALPNGYELRTPEMPDPENPNYNAWKEKLKQEFSTLPACPDEGGGESILIGHSLGASILLKYLSEEKFQKPIAGLFLIGAVFWEKGDREVEEFVLRDDFASRLPDIPCIYLYHSRDDGVVSVSHMDSYAKALPMAHARELHGRGHLFGKGLPELICDIRNLSAAVEVFTTNVHSHDQAHQLTEQIQEHFRGYEVNFDLEDCDKILRIKGDLIDVPCLIAFLRDLGVEANVLMDDPISTWVTGIGTSPHTYKTNFEEK